MSYSIHKFILSFIFFLSGAGLILGDEAFRNHRFDSFKVLPESKEGDIVFIGNSITNMMNWNELFKCNVNIRNRGTSGCNTVEILDNLESLIAGNPSKVFLMIGTNDLGMGGEENSPEKVAYRIKKILSHIIKKLPNAEIYYQSILPTRFGKRTREQTEETNSLVKKWIDNYDDDHLKYIDLYSVFVDENGDIKNQVSQPDEQAFSYDNLHLTQRGYKLWADIIKDYVGCEVSLSDKAINIWGDLNKSYGMRSTHFGAFPIGEDDFLFIGDEMAGNGEWNEMLNSNDIKNRGIGWGYPCVSLRGIASVFDAIFTGNKENGVKKSEPRGVLFYGGLTDVINNKEAAQVIADYKFIIKDLKNRLSGKPLFISTLHLLPGREHEKNIKILEINDSIRNFANEEGIYLVDVAAELNEGKSRREEFFIDKDSYFINGQGYLKMASAIAEKVNDVMGVTFQALSQDEGERNKLSRLSESENPYERFVVFDNQNSKVPYRIPAIAINQNGELLALADYRYSYADIGMVKNGKLDIKYRIKNHETGEWGEEKTLIAAFGEGDDNVAFGDPCVVADIDSDKILVTSCCGNVSFPKGTPENHQGWAIFLSEDGGKTWNDYKEISDVVFKEMEGHKDGINSFFIASGKIMQSPSIKIGKSHRLYCAGLFLLPDKKKANYVFYSDDFGENWKLLGEIDNCPFTSGADEAKVEELPDGSVLLSSRIKGGRFFNIFHYSDIENAIGKWEEGFISNSEVNGVTASENACNGEVLVVPVKNLEDGSDTYLLLQSVPFGPDGRTNVGINYKVLDGPQDYSTSELLARDWDGKFEITDKTSAYSTMILDKNKDICFLFEENAANGGYDIIFCRLSIPEITDYKFRSR